MSDLTTTNVEENKVKIIQAIDEFVEKAAQKSLKNIQQNMNIDSNSLAWTWPQNKTVSIYKIEILFNGKVQTYFSLECPIKNHNQQIVKVLGSSKELIAFSAEYLIEKYLIDSLDELMRLDSFDGVLCSSVYPQLDGEELYAIDAPVHRWNKTSSWELTGYNQIQDDRYSHSSDRNASLNFSVENVELLKQLNKVKLRHVKFGQLLLVKSDLPFYKEFINKCIKLGICSKQCNTYVHEDKVVIPDPIVRQYYSCYVQPIDEIKKHLASK